MSSKIRVWLDDDRETIHHADADQFDDMTVGSGEGRTDCDHKGLLRLVHHENVDMGKLCEGCVQVSGVRPPLEGQDLGPV